MRQTHKIQFDLRFGDPEALRDRLVRRKVEELKNQGAVDIEISRLVASKDSDYATVTITAEVPYLIVSGQED